MLVLAEWTRQWWDNYSTNYELVSSIAVIEELSYGDHPQQAEKIELLSSLRWLPITSWLLAIPIDFKLFLPSRQLANWIDDQPV